MRPCRPRPAAVTVAAVGMAVGLKEAMRQEQIPHRAAGQPGSRAAGQPGRRVDGSV